MKYSLIFLLVSSLLVSAQNTLFTSDFGSNTGAHVFAGNTDNTSGNASVAITDWTTHASVSAISGLSAIATGGGGFAQTQGGTGTYAGPNNIYLSRNHNLGVADHGYSFTFTIDATWDATNLNVLSGHSNNTGTQDQIFSSDLNFSLSGGTLGAAVTGLSTEDYATAPAYHSVDFDLTGTTLGAGTYTLQVYQNNNGSGSYAIYDGITLDGDNGAPPAPTVSSFTANKTYASPGASITFSWVTDGATTLTLNPGNIDLLPSSTDGDGSAAITVGSSGSYTLTATNAADSTTSEVEIFIGPARPNIVFLLVDDFGTQDTSVPFIFDGSGNPVSYNFNNFYQTPNMETLAANGMRFTTAYAQSVCSPTRAGLMTGRNSARHAVTDWVGAGSTGAPINWRKNGLDSSDITLPKLFQQGGYRTIHCGKAHFGNSGTAETTGANPLNLGFDVNIAGRDWGHPHQGYIGTPGYGMPGLEAYDGSQFLTKVLTIEANKAMENAVAEGRPFYLNMSFYAVHAPFTTNPDATGDYSGSTGPDHTKFATMVEGMDIAIGEIRQKLIDLGVAENTLIVFLGDNGSDSPAVTQDGLPSGSFSDFPLRGKKGSKWEGGSRVPMIACWATPDNANAFQQNLPIPANSFETDIVTSWDLPVTFLKVAGLPVAAGFGEDGYDLGPYFTGTAGNHRPQEVVIHYPHNHRSDFFSFIREGDMKLIYNYQSNSHQLYNLAADPTESNNLAAIQPELATRMTRTLAQRLDAMWGDAGPLKPTIATTAPEGNVITIPNDASVDVDADGLADVVEDPDMNGLVAPTETDPDDDNTDGDNIKDGDELKIGTDPLDANSYFRIEPTTQPDGTLQITWTSVPGAAFTIRSSTDLTTWPITIASTIPASAGANTSYNLGEPAGTRTFFRVELE